MKWTVAAFYSVTMFVCFIIEENNTKILFAGNCGDKCDAQYNKMYTTKIIAWFFMTLLNTIVTLFGIYKINLTVNDLKKLEPKLKTNHWMQSLHGTLLLLELAAVGI